MTPARFTLFFALILPFLAASCAGQRPAAAPGPASDRAPAVILWQPCTPEKAETLLSGAADNTADAFRGAACAASLLNAAEERDASRDHDKKLLRGWANRGYEAASIAAGAWPDNAVARYLTGYLAGTTARLTPLKGLDLVPVIEQEALRAAELDPTLDHYGPDRMLGNLYLSAPEPPLSIGDIGKALEHFEKAVSGDGTWPSNRLGLARASAADDEPKDACRELAAYYTLKDSGPDGKDASELLNKLCSDLN